MKHFFWTSNKIYVNKKKRKCEISLTGGIKENGGLELFFPNVGAVPSCGHVLNHAKSLNLMKLLLMEFHLLYIVWTNAHPRKPKMSSILICNFNSNIWFSVSLPYFSTNWLTLQWYLSQSPMESVSATKTVPVLCCAKNVIGEQCWRRQLHCFPPTTEM